MMDDEDSARKGRDAFGAGGLVDCAHIAPVTINQHVEQ
jgi:hypothetical protein